MTNQVVSIQAARKKRHSPANSHDFAQVDIEISADGGYSVSVTGGGYERAEEQLREAIRALQLQLLTMAR